MNIQALESNLKIGLSLQGEAREDYLYGVQRIVERTLSETCKNSAPDKYIYLSYLLAQVIDLNM
ncbi:hypothetical protein A9Q84_14545 [Halobacteriovorax marinus]|uniref:Uncharacterized protein n=1 Tax=Halobacteriovorax marinus TaxID=97084 RepID=A0A1Y5F4X9_9BACT|nr:hypothetical protein A9Q84_14545 [Halobacteriovorax marinus]